jgi:membrane protease YdiL (CAAX protease family)
VAVAIVLLGFILALLFVRLRARLERVFSAHPAWIWLAPLALTAIFAATAAYYGAFSPALLLLVGGYTLAPVACVYLGFPDIVAILLLWLPLEFGVGASLVPAGSRGVLHTVAYGISIALALTLFLLFRRTKGMKYNLPRGWGDLRNAAIGYAAVFPALLAAGLLTGFLTAPHAPRISIGTALLRVVLIFAGTALPEEILFRALIQNWLVRRFGESNLTILASALIFGCAHLDNGPQPLPNWRYALVASIAGFAFGKVFQKSASITASALLHTAVNTTKHLWF